MKANRRARHDEAGAEIIGALILFAIFVAVIAILNVTAVPNAGLASEEQHFQSTLAKLNGLQAEAEGATEAGSTVAASIELAPDRSVGGDFFSFFLATPARSSGELTFEPDYGNLSIHHYRQGVPTPYYDLGAADKRLPVGRISFDQHPNFRGEGAVHLENGGVVTTNGPASAMRFDPPVSVSVAGDTTHVRILARVLNGTGASHGGTAPVRVSLATEASTLTQPVSNNAQNATLRLETDHGSAWGELLNRTSQAAGLTAGQYHVVVLVGVGTQPDVVRWVVNGTGAGNDVRLTSGIAVHRVSIG